MHHRLSLWMAFFVFAAVGALRAQAPADAPMPPGQIVAKQVTGKVSVKLNGATTELHNEDAVAQSATVTTAADSSVVLVFSNGATTQLGADTTLVIEEFLQDPFQQTVAVGALTSEPTTSRTKLQLTKGELVGKVAHLKHDQGSTFTVQTPVGAAGIRGTTFRIVFRPSGTGQAFAVFSLSTLEGNVHFQQGGGSPAQAPTQPAAQTPGQPVENAQGQQGSTPAAGVAVTGGQEVVVTVSVNVNQQTGQVSVSAPTIVATQPLSVETAGQIVQQAQTLVATAATTTFTPPAAATPTPTTSQPTQTQQGDNGSTSGNSNSNSPANPSTDTTATPSNQAPATPTPPQSPPPPPAAPVTVPPPSLTPGAGRPQG